MARHADILGHVEKPVGKLLIVPWQCVAHLSLVVLPSPIPLSATASYHRADSPRGEQVSGKPRSLRGWLPAKGAVSLIRSTALIYANKTIDPASLSQLVRMDLEPLWEINEPWLSFEALDSRPGICLGFINADQQFDIFRLRSVPGRTTVHTPLCSLEVS